MITSENIPIELRNERRWVLWKLEDRNGKPTKVPYSVTGSLASSTNPSTWSDFAQARDAYKNSFEYSGVGCVISSPFCGIDLDACVVDGKIEPWAQEIIDSLDSYAEFSPGAGVHIWVKGIVPEGGNRKGKVEIYGKDRYFTVTGNQVAGTPKTVNERNLTALHKRYILTKAPEAQKDESRSSKQWSALLKIANSYKQKGIKPSHDDLKVKYLNTVSYDSKFDSKRGNSTWLDKDITKVMQEVFPSVNTTAKKIIVVRGNEIKLRNIEWIWKPFLARGELTVFAGLPDGGKGTTVANIVARITSHTPFPFEDRYELQNQDEVIMFSAEESHDTTTLPRIVAANGDRSKVNFVKGIEIDAHAKRKERIVSLLTDADAIREYLTQNPNVCLIVIDPIDCYFAGAKKNSAEDVTQIYGSLKKIADDFNVSILIIDHLNKDGDKAAIHRISGAGAAGARPRLAWVFGKDKVEKEVRHIACLKGNILKEDEKNGKKFYLKTVFIDIEGAPSSQSCVEWNGVSELSAEELLDRPDRKETVRLKAEKLLKDLTEPTSAEEIYHMAAELGVGKRTLDDVKADLGITSNKIGKCWFWVPILQKIKNTDTGDVATLQPSFNIANSDCNVQGCTVNI